MTVVPASRVLQANRITVRIVNPKASLAVQHVHWGVSGELRYGQAAVGVIFEGFGISPFLCFSCLRIRLSSFMMGGSVVTYALRQF